MELHGGNIHKKSKKLIDYSANINPLGVPKNLKKEIKKNIEDLRSYPDPEYLDLRETISKHIHVPMENIVVGNGATEIIFSFVRALKPQKALIISPTFAEYERALMEVSCEIQYFELSKTEKEFYVDLEHLQKTLEESFDLVVLCNPNNPTGSFVSKEKFLKVLEGNGGSTKFLIDEAFIDFIKNGEKKSFKHFGHKNIFIVRAFTKFFGIPGLRLGYGISFDKGILDKIYKIKEPWSLNSFASLAGKVLLGDKKYIKKTYTWLSLEKKQMFKGLKKIKGIKVYKTSANFFILKLKNHSGTYLYEKLMEQNFMIRRCENFRFLDDSFVRIAIKDKKNNKILVKKIKELID